MQARSSTKFSKREGKRNTGHTLRQLCAFCKLRFRSYRQRLKHTRYCAK